MFVLVFYTLFFKGMHCLDIASSYKIG